MHLQNHKVLITGGSMGVGLALARLLQKGNQVLICGRDAARLEAAKSILPGVETLPCDITNDAELAHLLATAQARLGGLSILINNAAVQHSPRFGTDSPASLCHFIDAEVSTNFAALAKLTALALPSLQRQTEAAIVNLGSGLAISPKSSSPVYCATKAAVHIFTRALRDQLEFHSPHVLVCEAMLPLVDTAMTAGRGRGKLSPIVAAQQILAGLERNQSQINVGKVKLLQFLWHLAPGFTTGLLRNSE